MISVLIKTFIFWCIAAFIVWCMLFPMFKAASDEDERMGLDFRGNKDE